MRIEGRNISSLIIKEKAKDLAKVEKLKSLKLQYIGFADLNVNDVKFVGKLHGENGPLMKIIIKRV